jgi:copper ion binding protein
MVATLKVQGMSCNHCVMHVTQALEGLDGVKEANVSLDKGVAVVEYDEGKVDLAAMKEAVEETGYEIVD